jgi:hypothetical protein
MLFGCLIILLTPYEGYTMRLPHSNWPVPVIFGQSHGIMLAGLILCPMILVIVTRTLFSAEGVKNVNYYNGYVLMFLTIVTAGWMQARGSILAVFISLVLLLLMSPAFNRAKKLSVIVVLLIGALCVAINPFQNQYSKQLYMQIFDSVSLFAKSDKGVTNKDKKIDRSSSETLVKQNEVLEGLNCHSVTNSVNDRWLHYQTAFALFMRYPYWGAGANKYGHYSCSGPGWYPHSTLLQVLAELGIFVFLVYISIILLSIRIVLNNFLDVEDLIEKSIHSFILAYFVFQFITSQIYGSYFMSAGLYFAIGIASRVACSDGRVLNWRRI